MTLRTIGIALSVLGSLTYAAEVEEFPFIGVSITSESVDLTQSQRDHTVAAIRWGKQTLQWRTMFTYQRGEGLRTFSLEVDKILTDELFGMPEFRPYLGFSVGKITYDKALSSDQNGYFYGASLGLIVYATDEIDADLSYHHYAVEEIEGIDTLSGPSIALHYFY